MGTRTFDIGDVLSITDGRLVSRRHIEGVYNILNHLAGCSLMTHELPAAMRIYGPKLLTAFPQLRKIDAAVELSASNIKTWLADCERRVGQREFEIAADPAPWAAQDAGPVGNLKKMLNS